MKLAGTDAKVYIEIHGKNGTTQIHRLHNSKARKEFQRDQMNHFHVSFLFYDDILKINLLKKILKKNSKFYI